MEFTKEEVNDVFKLDCAGMSYSEICCAITERRRTQTKKGAIVSTIEVEK